MTGSGAPSSRTVQTSVWTGTKMIVWGGYRSSNATNIFLNDGGLYDPSTNTWQTMSTTGAPAGRMGAAAVWTGTKMLIYGGSSFGSTGASTYYTDIGVYDPANNSWQVLNPPGAPNLAGYKKAVWTGTKMIVWGGGTDDSRGGIYDPVSNTWQTISNVGAPSRRGDFAMVWTGSKVIIWGGSANGPSVNANDYKNDGAIYDPSTNTWQAMSLVNAPASRYQPGYVWTGTKMIVWGGFRYNNAQIFLNDGGSFDPTTNTWQAISTTGAPSARTRPAAQWSGSKMIVWGGVGANPVYPNVGGIYDPATNTWQAMNTNGAPNGSYWLTSVWTGTKMLIWSFRPNTNYDAVSTNDGAIFY